MPRTQSEYPVCIGESDCFAREGGLCRILDNTDFGGRKCPFYKSQAQRDASADKSYWKLVDGGREDLIKKYKIKGDQK